MHAQHDHSSLVPQAHGMGACKPHAQAACMNSCRQCMQELLGFLTAHFTVGMPIAVMQCLKISVF